MTNNDKCISPAPVRGKITKNTEAMAPGIFLTNNFQKNHKKHLTEAMAQGTER